MLPLEPVRLVTHHQFPCIGVIADDLTGATVAGSALSAAGLRTVVVSQQDWPAPGESSPETRADWPAGAEALVVNVGSREVAIDPRLSLSTVPELVASAVRRLRVLRCPRIELRVDGALRRDYSSDVDAAVSAARLNNPLVLAVPAYPSAGRWTSGGRQVIVVPGAAERDVLVSSRLFGEHQSQVVTEATVAAGPDAIAELVSTASDVTRHFVVDAKNEAHLRDAALAAAILESEFDLLTVSSGGWLRYHPAAASSGGFVLMAMGLPTPPNETQLRQVLDTCHSRLMLVDEAVGLAMDPAALARCASEVDVMIIKATGYAETDSNRLIAAQLVADAVQAVLVTTHRYGIRCRGIIGAGAFTAARVAVALGATNILPTNQTAPAVPIGILSGGAWSGLPIAAKGGLVGGASALVEIVHEFMPATPD